MYLKGLLSDQEQKSVEPIALRFARRPDGGPATQNEVVGVFLTGVTPGGTALLDALEAIDRRYLMEVKKNTLVWTVDPATLPGATPGPKRRKKLGSYRYREVQSVAEIAALPPESWRMLKLREGAKGPLVCEFAALRLLRSAFARRKLTEEDAIELVEYHLQQNHTARERRTKPRGRYSWGINRHSFLLAPALPRCENRWPESPRRPRAMPRGNPN